jgi:DNA-binding NarL/FixJ family response regulator
MPEARIEVVICDDVAEMRTVLCETLEEDGRVTVVGQADNGRDGVRLAAELQPDVVLLDLSMPELDGLEAIPLIASAAPRSGIVIFTGFAADRLSSLALSLGADRYVEKGGPLEDLLAAVYEVAASRRDGSGGSSDGGDGNSRARRRATGRWNLIIGLGAELAAGWTHLEWSRIPAGS